jgi:hypothetical protein
MNCTFTLFAFSNADMTDSDAAKESCAITVRVCGVGGMFVGVADACPQAEMNRVKRITKINDIFFMAVTFLSSA